MIYIIKKSKKMEKTLVTNCDSQKSEKYTVIIIVTGDCESKRGDM